MRVTMNKETHRRKTAKESLALGTGRGAERPPREKRSPPALSRGRKLMRMFQTAKPEGDHEQGDERHGFWDIPCIVRSLHLRAHDAHERDTYGEANKQDHGAHFGTRLLQFLHDFFIKKKLLGA